MDKKATDIVAYFSLIGWIIAFCAGDKIGAKVHLNNALLLLLAEVITYAILKMPFVGWLVGSVLGIGIFVLWILGLVSAIQEQDKELPLIGGIKILK